MAENQPPEGTETPAPGTEDSGGETPPTEIKDPVALYELYEKKAAAEATLRTKLAETEGELDKLRKQAMNDQERAIAEAREAAAAEERTKYEHMLLQERITRIATGILADPDDAVRLLDPSEFSIDDPDTIEAAILKLVEVKPYLRSAKRGTIDQGARGKPIAATAEDANDWLRNTLRG